MLKQICNLELIPATEFQHESLAFTLTLSLAVHNWKYGTKYLCSHNFTVWNSLGRPACRPQHHHQVMDSYEIWCADAKWHTIIAIFFMKTHPNFWKKNKQIWHFVIHNNHFHHTPLPVSAVNSSKCCCYFTFNLRLESRYFLVK